MKFTAEQIQKAAACKSVDELLALAKAEGVEMARAEAEKFFASLSNKELNLKDLDAVAGGMCVGNVCGSNC